MILAPRSCPSSPGFATTTRIFPATARSLARKATSGTWFRTWPLETISRGALDYLTQRLGGAAGLGDNGRPVDKREIGSDAGCCPIAAPPPFLRTEANALGNRIEDDVGIDAK
jgi:hypothetical protein